jgi:hypothetical protein
VPKRAAPTLTKNVVEAGVWRRRPYRRRVVLPSETPKVFVNDLTRFEPFLGHRVLITTFIGGAWCYYRGCLRRLLPAGPKGKGEGVELVLPPAAMPPTLPTLPTRSVAVRSAADPRKRAGLHERSVTIALRYITNVVEDEDEPC